MQLPRQPQVWLAVTRILQPLHSGQVSHFNNFLYAEKHKKWTQTATKTLPRIFAMASDKPSLARMAVLQIDRSFIGFFCCCPITELGSELGVSPRITTNHSGQVSYFNKITFSDAHAAPAPAEC